MKSAWAICALDIPRLRSFKYLPLALGQLALASPPRPGRLAEVAQHSCCGVHRPQRAELPKDLEGGARLLLCERGLFADQRASELESRFCGVDGHREAAEVRQGALGRPGGLRRATRRQIDAGTRELGACFGKADTRLAGDLGKARRRFRRRVHVPACQARVDEQRQ
jgi:hypothetical protein